MYTELLVTVGLWNEEYIYLYFELCCTYYIFYHLQMIAMIEIYCEYLNIWTWIFCVCFIYTNLLVNYIYLIRNTLSGLFVLFFVVVLFCWMKMKRLCIQNILLEEINTVIQYLYLERLFDFLKLWLEVSALSSWHITLRRSTQVEVAQCHFSGNVDLWRLLLGLLVFDYINLLQATL